MSAAAILKSTDKEYTAGSNACNAAADTAANVCLLVCVRACMRVSMYRATIYAQTGTSSYFMCAKK